jgi:sporulation protein YlmC with PRC-barrel domain
MLNDETYDIYTQNVEVIGQVMCINVVLTLQEAEIQATLLAKDRQGAVFIDLKTSYVLLHFIFCC